MAIPVIEQKRCTGCGECAAVCEANAIEIIGEKARIEYTRCYSYTGITCQSCMEVCQREAISFID
ncbi:MAG: 4Fe-4S binding protein [Methanophagales archaeon]|nr:4Fe-4S binding protein [Methanophagales archaeon]